MGTIANKINKVKNTKDKIKTITNLSTLNAITSETIFKDYPKQILKEYVKIINNGTDELYTNFPKVEDEGTKLELDTEKGPLKMILEGNTSQKTSVLPEEYTQVEYIESTGTQYIDTGVNADDINYSFDIDFYGYETQPTTYHRNFGYQRNGGIFLGNKFWYGNNTNINCTDDLGTFNDERHSVFANKDYAIVDNVKYNLNTPPTNFIKNTSTKIAIFGAFDGGDGVIRNDSLSKIKLYSFKIYHNNNLIRNFIPAIRKSDNVVGMYDLITDTFYTNQGTGIFTYGSVVQIPNPDYPQPIKVVTGEQNITIQNKNLLDTSESNTTLYAYFNSKNGNVVNDGTKTNCIFNEYIKVEPNTSYTMSSDKITNSSIYTYVEYDKNKNFLKYYSTGSLSKKELTFITGSNTAYIRIRYKWSTGVTITNEIIENNKIQLENGPTVTTFTSYQSQTYPLSLGNIELARINNYKDFIFKNEVDSKYYNADLELDSWYLKNYYDIHTINNTDISLISSYWYDSTGCYGAGMLKSLLNLPNKVLDKKSLCDISKKISENIKIAENTYSFIANADYIFFFSSSFDTLENAKGILVGAKIMYELEIPTNTKITDTTLIQQLESINNNAKSYLGTTIIECSSLIEDNETVRVSATALERIN